jgi:hypothetical protein
MGPLLLSLVAALDFTQPDSYLVIVKPVGIIVDLSFLFGKNSAAPPTIPMFWVSIQVVKQRFEITVFQ